MQDDERLAPRPVLVRIGLDLGRVQDERVGLEPRELVLVGLDEHRLREERVVRPVGDDADIDALLGIRTREGSTT